MATLLTCWTLHLSSVYKGGPESLQSRPLSQQVPVAGSRAPLIRAASPRGERCPGFEP